MTDEQINQRIADVCGWVPDCDRGICWDQHGNAIITAPNYCSDLNAMHETEGALSLDRLYKLEAHLKQMAGAVCFRATARQRAEAFLRTLGKWEEA